MQCSKMLIIHAYAYAYAYDRDTFVFLVSVILMQAQGLTQSKEANKIQRVWKL